MADSPSPSVESPNESNDPTMTRAMEFVDKEVPAAVAHYNRLWETFMKSIKRENIKYFNMWSSGITHPLFVAAWEEEWRDYPESRPAFALYIRYDIKTSRNLREVKELDSNLDDETLFRNYLKHNEKYAEENLQKQAEYEKKIGGIPEDLKVAIYNPDSYSFVKRVYEHYVHVQRINKLNKQQAEEDAKEIARRKAIVPVDRNSKEYQNAFQEYKDAVAEQEQILNDSVKNDPTWIYSRDLILNGKVGESGFPGKQIDEFADSIKEEQRKDFHNWVRGFASEVGITTLKNEWDTKPESRPAITLYAAVMLMKMKKIPHEPLESLRTKLQNGDDFYKQFILVVKENEVPLNQLQAIEKNLRISAKLKNAIERNTADSTLFSIYDAYMRACIPKEFSDAEKKVSNCIDKLNNLRPNWAIEEKIVFPDKFSWKMHQLGLDVEKPYWTWQRILALSLLFLFILWVMIMKIKKWFEKKE
jgi:hypothetical protein